MCVSHDSNTVKESICGKQDSAFSLKINWGVFHPEIDTRKSSEGKYVRWPLKSVRDSPSWAVTAAER